MLREVVESLVRPDRFPDVFILFNKVITALAGGQGRRVHVQADLSIRRALPDLFKGLMADVPKGWDPLARHTTDVNVPVEIDEAMCPGRITGMSIVVSKCIAPGPPQADLGVRTPEGKGIFIRNDQAQRQRAFGDPRRDLVIESGDIFFPHGEDFAAMVVHRNQIDPVRAEFVGQLR